MKDDMNKELNTEQLDQVNGGVIGDSMEDSEVLYKLGILKEDIGFSELTFHWKTYSAKVVGVKLKKEKEFGSLTTTFKKKK